jgi:hypothetical protein
MTDKPASLAAALAILQTKLPEIRKSVRADVEGETKAGKPFKYSYMYANLSGISAQIMPLLGDLGLSFIAKPTFEDGRFVLAYSLLHESGQREDGQYPLPSTGTPQAIGSAITYGRRYALCAITGVAPEDDDDGATAEAESAGNRGTAQRRSPRPAPAAREAGTAQRAPGPALPGEDDNKPSDAQRRMMFALFKKQGVTDKDDLLTYVSAAVGHDIASSSELSKQQISVVIDKLQRWADQDQPPDGEATL